MNYESKGVFVFYIVLICIILYFTFLHGETQDSVNRSAPKEIEISIINIVKNRFGHRVELK